MDINRQTYEEIFLLYIDDELTPVERKEVEEFAWKHPDLQEELELLKTSMFIPENDILFENKEVLYREEQRKIIPFAWWKMTAAAIILFGLGTMGWLFLENKPAEHSTAPQIIVEKQTPFGITEKDKTTEEQPIQEPEIKKEKTIPTENKNKKNITRAERKPVDQLADEQPGNKQINDTHVDDKIANELPPPSRFNADVVFEDPQDEKVDIEVKAQQLDNPDEKTEIKPDYSNPQYASSSDNDMIYFANTSVSKKSKLRGVFRKATRILDKVTSLQ